MPTSQIIVTSRYIKSGTKKSKTKRSNYTKYIATRESVEKRPQNSSPVTKDQTQLINDLLTEFPKAKRFLEYEDYSAKPTAENASELISTIIERYADVLGNRRNFVGYMAMRPGAEKRGTHGLFNDSDKPIDLNAVADEVANHPGNIWTHVVSLRREDAVQLGYTNSDMWRELVKRHIADIAKAQNIPLANMKWYAAFHNTTHHPHIHLIVYSTNPKQGYLTKQGIEKIRSVFANDIFQDDLKSIYQQQTFTRDELKTLSENQMRDIISQFSSGEIKEELVIAIKLLHEQLQTVKGKKVYGYLPKEVKRTVDDIFNMLAQDERIASLYIKWCELESLKYKTYTLKPKSFPALTENKEFKSVRNMIIRTVLNMDKPLTVEPVLAPPEPNESFELSDLVNNQYGLYKYGKMLLLGENVEQDIDKGIDMLTKLADNGDTLSAYKLGKIYLAGEVVYTDLDNAEKYLLQAANDNNEYAMYSLAKLYLLDKKKDLAKAVKWLEKACENEDIKPYAAYTYAKILLDDNEFHNTARAIELLEDTADDNNWCVYLLGKLYLFGNDDVEKDKQKAIEWLTKSADDGNEYAEALLQHAEDYERSVTTSTVMSLFAHLARIIEDNYIHSHRKLQSGIDRKLRRVIEQKKEELGIKVDNTIHYDY